MTVENITPAPVELRLTLVAQVDPLRYAELDTAALVQAVAGPVGSAAPVTHLDVSATVTGGLTATVAAPGGES